MTSSIAADSGKPAGAGTPGADLPSLPWTNTQVQPGGAAAASTASE
jgi:hypothetical protein